MNIAGGTDVGSVRAANEDYYKIFKFDENSFCAVVADGMGGHKGGKVASTTAATLIIDYIRENLSLSELSDDTIFQILKDAIMQANEKLFIKSLTEEELSGMGTTVVAVIYKCGKLYTANIGDSRMYIIDNGIRQVTKDHSYVQDLIDKGIISENEAAKHPSKNIITRAVGTELDIDIDLYKIEINPHTKILLCTDGLTNFVDDKTIEKIMIEYNCSAAKDKLIELANKNGGRDNITLINIDFGEVAR